MLAAFMTNDLLWSIWPICCDGEFDRASVFRQFSPQNGRVLFLYLAALKLSGQLREARLVLWNNHDARGIEIETMYSVYLGVSRLKTSNKTVVIERMSAGTLNKW